MPPPKSIDAYMKTVPEPHRSALEKVRAQVQAAVPDAVEGVSYSMPAFKLRGKSLMCFAAFKDHCSIFPMSAAIMRAPEFAPYATSKGTLRFDPKKPISATLLKKIVKARAAEIDAAAAARSAKKKPAAKKSAQRK